MMMTRRDAVAAFALFADMLASGNRADAQTQGAPAAPPRPPVFKHDLPNVSLDGWEVTATHVHYPPGRVGGAHQHAGFVPAYLLEDALGAKILDQVPGQT